MRATEIGIAIIGAVSAVTASFFTAQSTSSNRTNAIDTKVQVLEERQQLQYIEVKGSLERIEKKLDTVLKP